MFLVTFLAFLYLPFPFPNMSRSLIPHLSNGCRCCMFSWKFCLKFPRSIKLLYKWFSPHFSEGATLFRDTNISLSNSLYFHQRLNEANENGFVAKVRNFSEKRWHSWDLVGEMLALRNDGDSSFNQIPAISHLSEHKSSEVSVFLSKNMWFK